jgi:hypothetical protein
VAELPIRDYQAVRRHFLPNGRADRRCSSMRATDRARSHHIALPLDPCARESCASASVEPGRRRASSRMTPGPGPDLSVTTAFGDPICTTRSAYEIPPRPLQVLAGDTAPPQASSFARPVGRRRVPGGVDIAHPSISHSTTEHRGLGRRLRVGIGRHRCLSTKRMQLLLTRLSRLPPVLAAAQAEMAPLS